MRTLGTATLLILALGFVAALVAPWWGLAAVAFAVGLATRLAVPGRIFWAGLLGGGLLWGLSAAYFDLSGGALPARIADLFGLGSGLVLGLTVALVGGLTAGLAGLIGAYLRATIQPVQT